MKKSMKRRNKENNKHLDISQESGSMSTITLAQLHQGPHYPDTRIDSRPAQNHKTKIEEKPRYITLTGGLICNIVRFGFQFFCQLCPFLLFFFLLLFFISHFGRGDLYALMGNDI